MKINKLNLYIILAIVCTVNITRFLLLENSPPGFYVDEAIGAANVICMNQTGHDANKIKYPLFAQAAPGGGFTTPVYLYGGATWVRFFGTSIYSFRAFSAFIVTLTLLFIFLFAQATSNNTVALFAILAASLSPWAWQFSRLAWDPPLMPLFLMAGSYFFLGKKNFTILVSALCFSLAMYSYAAGRVVTPLWILVLVCYGLRNKTLTLKRLIVFSGVLILFSMPLMFFLTSPEALTRAGVVSIFNKDFLNHTGGEGVFNLVKVFLQNYFLHFKLSYLFTTGDANLRHSTQFSGQFSWLDCFNFIYLFLLILPKTRAQLKFDMVFGVYAVGFLISIIPAALTWESIPHALRSIACWPFLALATGYALYSLQNLEPKLQYAISIVCMIYALRFGYNYFEHYPLYSRAWFDSHIKEYAITAKKNMFWQGFDQATTNYLKNGSLYYKLHYGQIPCDQTFLKQ